MGNLFKNDVVKQNNKILENLLNTKELIEHIDQDRIKQSVDLSMRYWTLLKESKGTIKEKKGGIDSLLDICEQWNIIITKQRKLTQGSQLNDDEIGFIKYVCDEFKEWFKDEPKIESIRQKWSDLYKELSVEQAWWQRKKTEIVDFLKKQKDKIDAARLKKLNQSSTWMSKLLIGIGTVLATSAAVVLVVGGIALFAAAVITIGAAVG